MIDHSQARVDRQFVSIVTHVQSSILTDRWVIKGWIRKVVTPSKTKIKSAR